MSTNVATDQITQAFKQFLNASKDLQIQQALDSSNEWAKFGSNFHFRKIKIICDFTSCQNNQT